MMANSTQKDSCYAYARLPSSTSIRLVELDPSFGDKVSFSLHTFELHESPPFEALSYTWGDPRSSFLDDDPASTESYRHPTQELRCDGSTFMVRLNLFQGLRMLQSTTYIQRQRFVWIDAICINQDDIEERSSQVKMMSNIFERADYIIGWLGQADDTTADAITVMERLSSISRLPLSNADIGNIQRSFEHISQAEFFDPKAYHNKLGIRFITAAEWLAWIVFLSRPYFERSWIVQEVNIAKRILLVCGRYIIPWSQLAKAIFFLGFVPQWGTYLNRGQMHYWVMPGSPETSKFERMLVPEASESVLPIAAASLVKIRTYARFDVQDGRVTPKVFSLYSLLECFRSSVATDPRDKIFALLSIADRTKAPFADPSASIILSPDYKLSTEVFFIRLTRLMVRCHGDLRIFQHRELNARRRLRSLPSWVPDYSVAQIIDRLGSALSNCDWKSSGDEKYYANSRYGKRGNPGRSLLKRALGRFHRFNITHYGRSPGESVCTPIFGAVKAEPPDSTYCSSRLLEKMEELASVVDLQERSLKGLDTLAYKRAIEEFSLTNPLLSVFKERSKLAMSGRLVFRTEDGHFFGLGPADTRPGDEIWVLSGAKTPFILRPSSSGRRVLLGEAYVYGLMHGQAVKYWPNVQDITLQ
ncbi:hypothetical protein S40293_05070 [Stachybotrys chartarum IBT 40293]|nr:hypothetical protein S40293_05070 [Stachybotrys chartarum IBT 40293]KFA78783.1 hypothetical protein S40288_08977 [Stachybotrys chartarum IBT 40288]